MVVETSVSQPSFCVLLLQSANPVLQAGVQVPLEQVALFALARLQTTPHAPQSLTVSPVAIPCDTSGAQTGSVEPASGALVPPAEVVPPAAGAVPPEVVTLEVVLVSTVPPIPPVASLVVTPPVAPPLVGVAPPTAFEFPLPKRSKSCIVQLTKHAKLASTICAHAAWRTRCGCEVRVRLVSVDISTPIIKHCLILADYHRQMD